MLCGLPPFFHHEMPAADRKRIGECDIQVEQVLGPPGIYNRYLYIYIYIAYVISLLILIQIKLKGTSGMFCIHMHVQKLAWVD